MGGAGVSTVMRVDDDVAEGARRRAAAASSSPSEVLRAGLAALDASPAARVSVPRELGRVDLVVPVRAESVAWLDEVARVCGWSREQAARQALSEGRRVLSLQLARKPAGRRAEGVTAAEAVDARSVPEADDAPGELEDASVPV
jgi:hypothetical protein